MWQKITPSKQVDNGKTICEKMKNCKVMNINVLIFILQLVGSWKFRKCIKRGLFLILLRKTSIFVL